MEALSLSVSNNLLMLTITYFGVRMSAFRAFRAEFRFPEEGIPGPCEPWAEIRATCEIALTQLRASALLV